MECTCIGIGEFHPTRAKIRHSLNQYWLFFLLFLGNNKGEALHLKLSIAFVWKWTNTRAHILPIIANHHEIAFSKDTRCEIQTKRQIPIYISQEFGWNNSNPWLSLEYHQLKLSKLGRSWKKIFLHFLTCWQKNLMWIFLFFSLTGHRRYIRGKFQRAEWSQLQLVAR